MGRLLGDGEPFSCRGTERGFMKAVNGCIPCIMKQAYNTAIRATDDKTLIREILDRTAEYVKNLDLDTTPADASNFAYRTTRSVTGNDDPYRDEKREFNDRCLALAPMLRERIEKQPDPLEAAARVTILGNIIDLGIGTEFDLDREVEGIFTISLGIDDYPLFRESLSSGRRNILYIGDNAGEIVFDMLLIERLVREHDVTHVVRGGPVINDATMDDARFIGLTDMVPVIETGSDGIGIEWSSVSGEFLDAYERADVIISKGQGNFETLSDSDKEIYFLLKMKCGFVADMAGAEFGDLVFRKGPIR